MKIRKKMMIVVVMVLIAMLPVATHAVTYAHWFDTNANGWTVKYGLWGMVGQTYQAYGNSGGSYLRLSVRSDDAILRDNCFFESSFNVHNYGGATLIAGLTLLKNTSNPYGDHFIQAFVQEYTVSGVRKAKLILEWVGSSGYGSLTSALVAANANGDYDIRMERSGVTSLTATLYGGGSTKVLTKNFSGVLDLNQVHHPGLYSYTTEASFIYAYISGMKNYGYYLDNENTLSSATVNTVKAFSDTQILMCQVDTQAQRDKLRANVALVGSNGQKVIVEMIDIFLKDQSSLWHGKVDTLLSTLTSPTDLRGYITAMYVLDEPWYNGWTGGDVEAAIGMTESHFPGIPTMVVETPDYFYCGVTSSVDWVGVDPYPWSRWPSAYEGPGGDAQALADYQYWMTMINDTLDNTTLYDGKEVFLVGQAFGWPDHWATPKPAWQQWYLDSVRYSWDLKGIFWFCYDRSSPSGIISAADISGMIDYHHSIGHQVGY